MLEKFVFSGRTLPWNCWPILIQFSLWWEFHQISLVPNFSIRIVVKFSVDQWVTGQVSGWRWTNNARRFIWNAPVLSTSTNISGVSPSFEPVIRIIDDYEFTMDNNLCLNSLSDGLIYITLSHATSQDVSIMKSAEQKLIEWETQPGFYASLSVTYFATANSNCTLRIVVAYLIYHL